MSKSFKVKFILFGNPKNSLEFLGQKTFMFSVFGS